MPHPTSSSPHPSALIRSFKQLVSKPEEHRHEKQQLPLVSTYDLPGTVQSTEHVTADLREEYYCDCGH